MKLTVNEPTMPGLAYKEHRIVIAPVGKGWRAMIYAPDSLVALPESPANLEKSTKEAIVAEAKWIVDALTTVSSR